LFNRSILANLHAWYNRKKRKPLVLRGARQVGKTCAVDIFAEDFKQYIKLNLEQKVDRDLFESDISVSNIYQTLLLRNNFNTHSKTLLFIDEIQQSPQAIKKLRYFKEELPHVPVIAAGSLLEIMLEKYKISFPVGRVEFLYMYPLSFMEFLNATGQEALLEAYKKVPVEDFAHSTLQQAFHNYAMVGGLPEIVEDYRVEKSLPNIQHIYQSLIQSYIDDAAKYASSTVQHQIMRHCIESAPLEAGSRIKFTRFGNSNYKAREIGGALRTLEHAMLLHLVYPTVSIAPPILPDFKKHPKLQFLDTGLCNYAAGLHSHYLEQKDLHSFYQGRMAEHIVFQELLVKNQNQIPKTCFWTRESKNSNAEVDAVMQHNTHLIPIEVKSGKTGRLRSLHLFMDASQSPVGIRLSAAPFSKEKVTTTTGTEYTLLNIPYYHTGMVERYLEVAV